MITTILAIPNYRLQPTGNTVFQYLGSSRGAAQSASGVVLSGRQLRAGVRIPETNGCADCGLCEDPRPRNRSGNECRRGSEDGAARGCGRKRQDRRIGTDNARSGLQIPTLCSLTRWKPRRFSSRRLIEPLRPKHPRQRRRCQHTASVLPLLGLGRTRVIGPVCRPWISLQAPASLQGLGYRVPAIRRGRV